MKLSQLLNCFDEKSAFLLGMIYAWPMISKDSKIILAYSAYKFGSKSEKVLTKNIKKFYIEHKEKLQKFLGKEFQVELNNDIDYQFNRKKLLGVSVVLENDIDNNKIYGVIEKYLIDLDDDFKKWFLIGFMDGRGSLDFTAKLFSIDIAKDDEITKRKLNTMYNLLGFSFNYNPRILQKESHTKNDQFRLSLEYYAGNYGFFRPFLIEYYQVIKHKILKSDDGFVFYDEDYKGIENNLKTKNLEINEFALSIKGLSKEEKLEKAKEYRLQYFDFDSEDEVIYSNVNVKEEAKAKANYECEINNDHITFISKANNQKYVEAHHLIPFSKRNEFDVSIDVVDNLVALCPNCHRKIHLATDNEKKRLLDLLLEKREKKLKENSILIDKSKLYQFYGVQI